MNMNVQALFCLLLCLVSTGSAQFWDRRVKRFIPPAGGDACLQIYSVPKRSVKCEASQDTVDALTALNEELTTQKAFLDALSTRLDEVDPSKPKELPEEVKQRLDTIDEVKLNQAGHQEFLKRLEGELTNLNDRIEAIENGDREELAKLITLQTELIQSSLHKNNVSLHDAYIDTLAENTRDLTSRLKDLEAHLKDTIHTTENALEAEVKTSEGNSKLLVEHLRERLKESLLKFEEKITGEKENRMKYQNLTEANKQMVAELIIQLTNLRQHQVNSDVHKGELNDTIAVFGADLLQEKTEKQKLMETSEELKAALQLLQENFFKLKDELGSCRNRSDDVDAEVKKLAKAIQRKDHLLPRTLKMGDCQDALKYYHPASGVYLINPYPVPQPFEVYCDMTDTDGWTVIQRRQDGATNFFRGWEAYKNGFGDAAGEYWLGLQKIHVMTTMKKYRLRVDMLDWEDAWWYAEYDSFFIDSEDISYKLHISGYHGDAGDSLSYHDGMPFSTMDKNNDENSGICATWCHGAWWYKDCFHSNLNGRFYSEGPYVTRTGWGDGVVWRHIHGSNFYSLKAVAMKIKPVDEDKTTPVEKTGTS